MDEPAKGLVVLDSDADVASTVARLTQAVEDSPARVIAVVDHAAGAAQINSSLPPTVLVLVGNPALGSPLMQARRSIGIDLPQKFLIWHDDDGRTKLAYNDPEYIANRHGVTQSAEVVASIAAALRTFARRATGQ